MRTAFLSTLVFAASLSSCADNESSLFIQGVLSLGSSDCVARPDAEAEMLTQGVLDVHFAQGYVAAVLVGNQLTQQGNREKTRTETSRLRIEGAKGTVFDVSGGEHPFEAIATGFVHPAAGTEPGLAAVSVNLISTDLLAEISGAGGGTMVVRFRVFGTTLGGQEIESGDFDYPIYVCDGCLVDYPASAFNGTNECMPDAEVTQEQKICFYGQDQVFPCSACAALDPICRDPTQNPWNQ